MTQLIALPAAVLGCTVRPPHRVAQFKVEQIGAGEPDRAGLEAFISRSFYNSYGAEVSHFCDILLGCRDEQGNWIAALGYTLAENNLLFLEQYLDASIEAAIGARVKDPVGRANIVEVGNLTSSHPGAARALIVSTTRLLHGLGLDWVAFTATVGLLNSFTRLKLQPQVLAIADPMRLGNSSQHWGRYFNNQPQVMFGDIRYGYVQLT